MQPYPVSAGRPAAAACLGRDELPRMRLHTTEPFPSFPSGATEWLEDRAARDGAEGGCPSDLWLIDGVLYDMSSFVDSHPGGRQWLQMTRGSDCTDAFETHHLNMKRARSVLQRFAVGRPAKEPSGKTAAYIWRDDGFYRSTRHRAWEALQDAYPGARPAGPTGFMLFLSTGAALLFVALFLATCVSASYVAATLAGYAIFVLMGVGHNFFHQQDSLWRFAWDVSMFSVNDWRASHAISHHLYPNLDPDLEASALEPLVSFMRNRPTNPLAVYLYWWPLNWIIPLQQMMDQWRRYLVRRTRPRPEDLIVCAECAALVSGCGLGRGLGLFLYMHGVALLLIQLVSTPVHRSEFSWTEGCPGAAFDFGEHIILTTQEYWTSFCAARPRLGLAASLFLFAGFNQHVTHHMFPTCDLSKQHVLTAVIHAQADAFGIPRHRPRPLWELLRSTIAVWHRTGGSLSYRPPDRPAPGKKRE